MPLLVWSEVMIFSIHGTNLFYLVSVNLSNHSMPTEDVGLLTDELEYVRWLGPGKFCTQEGICETAPFSWLQRQGPLLASQSGSGLHSQCPGVWWQALFSLQGGKSKVIRLETLFYPPYSIRYSPQMKQILEHEPHPARSMSGFQGIPQALRMMCKVWHGWAHTLYCGCRVWRVWAHTLFCERKV